MEYTVALEGSRQANGRGDPRTGLDENTLFCAFWIEAVNRYEVVHFIKTCPESAYLEIRELIERWERANPPPR